MRPFRFQAWKVSSRGGRPPFFAFSSVMLLRRRIERYDMLYPRLGQCTPVAKSAVTKIAAGTRQFPSPTVRHAVESKGRRQTPNLFNVHRRQEAVAPLHCIGIVR